MNHKAYQPKMPDRMEAVFDAAYLIFDLIAGTVSYTHLTLPTILRV